MRTSLAAAATLLFTSVASAQTPADPFPSPIGSTQPVVRVNFADFATLPDIDGVPARMMTMVDEPGTRRLFVSDMRGPLYGISYDGRTVAQYVNLNDPQFGVRVQSQSRERGVQSFAFHPQFAQQGSPGYGKFYVWTDTQNNELAADFRPGGGTNTHHTVLLEFTARNAAAATYDGGPPRELMRFEQPFANHNAGHLAFRPLARPGDADFGLLYVGVADGGSGGDPLNLAQNLRSAFGKILRIDPLGTNGANGKYGIPASNPFVREGGRALPEIYAYGMRNPQRFGWDPSTGTMFMADIGQNVVEKLSTVPAGANLGWNTWEGSFRFGGRGISLDGPRGDPRVTFPVAEYDQTDPLLQNQSAATGVVVYRSNAIPQLANLILWGDQPQGEIFYVRADNLPSGGQAGIGRVLLNDGGEAKRLLDIIRARNTQQGRNPMSRSDMRFGESADGRVFLLNKSDGVIRVLVP
jgi:glucose/arabinose dehydrogenase